MDNVPAPLQALLPYLKWLASLIVVIIAAAATVVTLPAWAVLLGAVAASAGVYFAKNQAKPRKLGDALSIPPEYAKELRDALMASLHGPAINPLNGPEPSLPVTSVPASAVSASAQQYGTDWYTSGGFPPGTFPGTPPVTLVKPSLGALPLPPEGSGIVPGDTAADVERKLDELKRKGPE